MLSTNTKIAIARHTSSVVRAARNVVGKQDHLTARRSGLLWQLDLGEGIDFSIYLLGGFELATLKRYRELVTRGDVVFDIGANIGAHTLPLARLVGASGQVHAFEPTQYAFGKLETNLGLNQDIATCVTAKQILLGNTGTELLPDAIYASWPLEKSNDLHEDHSGRLKSTDGAVVTSVDAYVAKHGIDRIDFVKLDVDGNELTVLEGAKQTFQRHSPLVVVEMAPYVFQQPDEFDRLIQLFAEWEYSFEDLNSGNELPVDPGKLRGIIPAVGGLNVLAKSAMRR